MTLHLIALELTAVFALWLALGALQQDRDLPGRGTFAALCMTVLLWCTGELLAVRGAVSYWMGVKIKYLGIVSVAPLWLGLAAHVGGLEVARRVPWFPAALLIPGLGMYATLYLGPWQALFLAPTADGADSVRGPLWHVHVVYAYVLIATGCTIYAVSALRDGRPGRMRRLAIGATSLFPFAANALFIFGGLPTMHDPAPVLMGLTMVAMRPLMFPGSLLEVLPVAQRDIIDHLPFGVVLADPHGMVIDLNGAAERGLGLHRREALGRDLDAVLSHVPRGTKIETSAVERDGRKAARFALLDFGARAQARRERAERSAA
jgi:PAS domain-containing protein